MRDDDRTHERAMGDHDDGVGTKLQRQLSRPPRQSTGRRIPSGASAATPIGSHRTGKKKAGTPANSQAASAITWTQAGPSIPGSPVAATGRGSRQTGSRTRQCRPPPSTPQASGSQANRPRRHDRPTNTTTARRVVPVQYRGTETALLCSDVFVGRAAWTILPVSRARFSAGSTPTGRRQRLSGSRGTPGAARTGT
jgi:hypothetical protein